MKAHTLKITLLLGILLLTACTGGGGGGGGSAGPTQQGQESTPQVQPVPDDKAVEKLTEALEQVWVKVEKKWKAENKFSRSVSFGKALEESGAQIDEANLEEAFLALNEAYNSGRVETKEIAQKLLRMKHP